MVTRDILNSHSVSTLKKEISKTNVKGYSKMKKAEVVDLMMKNKERFAHIKHKNLVKSAKVQAIANDFAASVAKGNKVAERVRKTKEVAPPKKAPSNKQYEAEYWYEGGRKIEHMNEFMDMKSLKTGRTVGYKRVISKLQKYLDKQKKAGKSVSGDDVITYLNSAYPDTEYYLE
jgi:hypothetical protein